MEKYCISIPSAGGYEKLTFESLSERGWTLGAHGRVIDIPDEQNVVVRVHAAGVNYADIIIRWGLYSSAKEYVGWPITPGFEFSGVVEEKGSDCDEFEIGDEVFGATLFGAYTTHLKVPKQFLLKRPSFLSVEEAAGMPCVASTAYYAIYELAHVKEGYAVLVHSAAGGVGSMLVQMCKIAGCRVIGVVGASHKVDAARQLGCDEVIDKSVESLWVRAKELAPKGYKVVFDANGTTISDSYAHLASGGKLVVYGFHSIMPREGGRIGMMDWLKMGVSLLRAPTFNPVEMTTSNRSVMAFNLSYMFSEHDTFLEAMKRMVGWIEEKRLRMPAIATVPLQNVAEAHKRLESAQTVGKLVLICQEKTLGHDASEDEEHAKAEDTVKSEKSGDE